MKKREFLTGNMIKIFAFIIVICLLGFIVGTEENQQKSTYAAVALDLPGTLDFANEKVPLENFDTRESLDRELLVNVYWHSHTLLLLKRANRYFPVIEPILKKYNIPDDFKYLPVIESDLSNLVSPIGAIGFWQFLEGTAKEYGLEVNNEVDERYNLEKSTEAACKFFFESYAKYKNWTLAAASYNIGRKGLSEQIQRQNQQNYYDLLLGEETERYIFRILSIKIILTEPEKYGYIFRKKNLYPVIPEYKVEIDSTITDFARFAKNYSTNYKMLKLLNPWLREKYLTNKDSKTYFISIPQEGFRDCIIQEEEIADTLITLPVN